MLPPAAKQPPSSLFLAVLWGPQRHLVLWSRRNHLGLAELDGAVSLLFL